MGRAPCCDKANVKRGPWSPEEDSKLKDYIDKNGTAGNWIALPHKAGLKRCGKSCRLRWLNYLRPNIRHGEFSEEEDRIICSLYVNIGSRWSIIAAQLSGRTDNDIKNYWNTKLKKKLMGFLPQSHQKIKPSTFSSSNQNQNQPQHYSPSSSSMYIDYFASYNNYNYTPETTTYCNNTLDPTIISSLAQSGEYEIASTVSSQPFYQNQDKSIMASNDGYNNSYYYYHHPIIRNSIFNVFGSEGGGSCSTSSDGSCSHGRDQIIKQEEIMMSSYNSIIINDCGQSQTEQVPLLDYDVEDIKELVSVSSSSFNNNNNNNNIDEIKGENDDGEGKKSMHYYYYY